MPRRPRIYVNAAQILSGLVAFVELLYFGLGLDYYVPGVPSSHVPVLVAISNTAGVRVDLKWLLSTTLANPIAKRVLRSADAASSRGSLRIGVSLSCTLLPNRSQDSIAQRQSPGSRKHRA